MPSETSDKTPKRDPEDRTTRKAKQPQPQPQKDAEMRQADIANGEKPGE